MGTDRSLRFMLRSPFHCPKALYNSTPSKFTSFDIAGVRLTTGVGACSVERELHRSRSDPFPSVFIRGYAFFRLKTLTVGGDLNVWSTTQYRSVSF
jgi:hypothetical protein